MKQVNFTASTPDGATIREVRFANGVVERSVTAHGQSIVINKVFEVGEQPIEVRFCSDSCPVYVMEVKSEDVEGEKKAVEDEKKVVEDKPPTKASDAEREKAKELGDILSKTLASKVVKTNDEKKKDK